MTPARSRWGIMFICFLLLTACATADRENTESTDEANGGLPASPYRTETAAIPQTSFPDSDRDGVIDVRDKCPDTEENVFVDNDGCEHEIEYLKRMMLNIQFAVNSAAIVSDYKSQLQQVANAMIDHPHASVLIEGHTDNTGEKDYNQELSERRAAAVAQKLITYAQESIDKNRISWQGFGESKPIADNNTEAGRQKNRRIEAVLYYSAAENPKRWRLLPKNK